MPLDAIDNVLEIGSGKGEHLPFVKQSPRKSYVCLDIRRVKKAQILESLSLPLAGVVKFVQGNAENIPFPDDYFDRTLATCLLHHVDDPLQVLLEMRRVTKNTGEIAFVLPTDPGLLNRLVKRLVSFPRMRKISKYDPNLIYALEHRNHISGLIELIKFVYQEDRLKFHFAPFKIHSWNLNLLCVVHIVRSS